MGPRSLLATTLATTLLATGALIGAGCGSDGGSGTSAAGTATVSAANAKKLSAACGRTAATALALSKSAGDATSAALTSANNAVDNIAVSLGTVTVPQPAKQAWAAVVRHLGDASDALDDGIVAVVGSQDGQAATKALTSATREVEKAVSSFQLLAAEAGFECPVK